MRLRGRTSRTPRMLLALAIASAPIASPAMAQAVSPLEALAIATEAYIYGYPIVTMEMTRWVMTNAVTPEKNHAPMGQFFNSRTQPDASFRDVTAPNADTLYPTGKLNKLTIKLVPPKLTAEEENLLKQKTQEPKNAAD